MDFNFRIQTFNTVYENFQIEAARRFDDRGYFYLYLTTSTTYTFLGQTNADLIKSNYD
jgi:hypothetical protein